LVQHYVQKHGGIIANGIDTPVQVLVRVHETDQITADNSTIIFDPWRSYPKANNVVYYGKYEQLKDIDNGTNKSSISNA
jgi:hypothetical protein